MAEKEIQKFKAQIFDDLLRLVDQFLTDCVFEFDSEGGMKLETGPLVEALEVVAPGHYVRWGEFTDEIVGPTGKKRRLDLEEKHNDLVSAHQQASFLLGLILGARLTGARAIEIQRLKAGYERMGNMPPS